MEIDMRDKKTVEPYGVESTNQESTHGFRSEKLVKSAAQATLTHHTLTSRVGSSNTHSGQVANINVNIEWDVLESFTEFATFLELQNPICPAELLDTPEKLMNVLVWQHFRAHWEIVGAELYLSLKREKAGQYTVQRNATHPPDEKPTVNRTRREHGLNY